MTRSTATSAPPIERGEAELPSVAVPAASTQRLGIFVDAPYRVVRSSGGEIVGAHPADYSLVGVFLAAVGQHFRSATLFGRATDAGELDHFVALPSTLRLERLPDYESLLRLRRVLGASVGTLSRFWTSLDRLDTVLVFGPHPFAFAFAVLALARRRHVVLGVRQDTISYFRARLPSRRWVPTLAVVHAIDLAFRVLARRVPTLVAGTEIAGRYGGESGRVLVMSDSVVRSGDVALAAEKRDTDGPIELLTVGRIDPEKNPLLLVDALAELNRLEPGRFRLTWVGSGPLEQMVRSKAGAAGLEELLDLRGWLPFGPEVLDLYRRAHVFVHVSLTEGVPRVLTEALACATPVVATDVGGVSTALEGGRAALLVPPSDLDALVGAIRTMARDARTRTALVERGLALARDRTLEPQAARVAQFVSSGDGLRAAADGWPRHRG